ncbi:MFS transporter [Alicyclobacillus contaminans]|uniref:MFS transporter n=1 Tax=Alicyclobacillus contaminans TaxID=392016 RepID=UPI000428F989|nr:MFS transporter [Alicyclobacillus contaminans]GMA49626.1 MFS transporter [Alicyclobacillus contaminans]
MRHVEATDRPVRSRYRWVVFAALALTYLLVFTQRTGPGVISNQLQARFGVSSAVLGTMASVQYFLYMILQVPIGAFADRLGPERLFITGAVLDGLGTVVFSGAPDFAWLLVGRALVGAGDALIWINIVLIVGRWFAAQEFGGILGFIGTFGNVGALLATIPFAAWVSASGWRGPFCLLGVLLLLVAASDLLALRPGARRRRPVESSLHVERIPLSQTLNIVVRERISWATFLCHFGVMGSYLGFTGLWAVPVFMDMYHISRPTAAQFVLVGFIGAILGGPVVGYISDRFGERRRPYIVLQALATLAWLVVPLWGGHPPQWMSYLVLFVLGFGCGGSLLTFATIRDATPASRSGVTSGFANMGGFLSAVLLPVLFGAVLDAVNPTHVVPGPARGYALAFLAPALFSACGVLGSCLLPKSQRAGRRVLEAEEGV